MITTSYYKKSGKDTNSVSIAGKSPSWFFGREYKKLAPKYWFFKKYKEDGDKNFYIECYYKEVLNKLDPLTIYKELGPNAILLCWEEPSQFCHRHLVADWLNNNLNLNIKELL